MYNFPPPVGKLKTTKKVRENGFCCCGTHSWLPGDKLRCWPSLCVLVRTLEPHQDKRGEGRRNALLRTDSMSSALSERHRARTRWKPTLPTNRVGSHDWETSGGQKTHAMVSACICEQGAAYREESVQAPERAPESSAPPWARSGRTNQTPQARRKNASCFVRGCLPLLGCDRKLPLSARCHLTLLRAIAALNSSDARGHEPVRVPHL